MTSADLSRASSRLLLEQHDWRENPTFKEASQSPPQS